MTRPTYILGAVAAVALAAAAIGSGAFASGSVAIPVPPPRGAVRSGPAIAPFETIGSPYLRTKVQTYLVRLTPQQVHDYYTPRLSALGYRWSGSGSSCGGPQPCTSDWAYGLGQYTTFVLTVQPIGTSRSRYSAAVEHIALPPRPKASIVPSDVESLKLTYRASASSPWISRVFRASQEWKSLRRLVNGLPVDGRGAYNCAADFGTRATLLFRTGSGTYLFSENPACTSVTGPGPVSLEDVNVLWPAIMKALHVPNSYRY